MPRGRKRNDIVTVESYAPDVEDALLHSQSTDTAEQQAYFADMYRAYKGEGPYYDGIEDWRKRTGRA
jgi:hypothetical protein